MQLRLADVPGLELAISSIQSVGIRILKKQVVKREKRENCWEDHQRFCRRKTVKRLYNELDSFGQTMNEQSITISKQSNTTI